MRRSSPEVQFRRRKKERKVGGRKYAGPKSPRSGHSLSRVFPWPSQIDPPFQFHLSIRMPPSSALYRISKAGEEWNTSDRCAVRSSNPIYGEHFFSSFPPLASLYFLGCGRGYLWKMISVFRWTSSNMLR